MTMLEWNDSLVLRIATVDAQHHDLVTLINGLYDAMRDQADTAVLMDTVQKLREYTVEHFRDEEALMRAHAYARLAEHEQEHAEFIAKVQAFEDGYRAGQAHLSMEILNFLSEWLVSHINGSDRTACEFLVGKGVS